MMNLATMTYSKTDTCFSCGYCAEYSDKSFSVNWNPKTRRWTRSERQLGQEHDFRQDQELDLFSYDALCAAFGLSKDDFSLEEIVCQSPKVLATKSGYDPMCSMYGDCRRASEAD